MRAFLEDIIKKIIFRLFLSNVKTEETTEIVRIINKSVGLSWAVMDNVMLFKNTFPVPYTIKSIKTTMYNDAGQNIGYMDFEGDILVPKKGSVEKKIESRMSNITALFNMARFVLFDQVKIKAEGYTEIQIWRFVFKLPVNQIIKVNSKMVQFQSDEQIEEARKRRERESLIRAYKRQKQIERKQREKEEYLQNKEKGFSTVTQSKPVVEAESLEEELINKSAIEEDLIDPDLNISESSPTNKED